MICNREKRLRAKRPNVECRYEKHEGRKRFVVWDGDRVLCANRSKREAFARSLATIEREEKRLEVR